ncbi:MAG: 1-deoxy-D-xylulose-5-phosphate reductoisomerase [Alloprevotella sp.]|nr:1-deoxy-D-xylulose-5-phosphate reductoisomerase [Bacteroidales bacterium]MDY3943314.1 1-deoxy-D-xylulose-5-phosphate reductoisomerase [Alloprevotella sp.]
MKALAILGSTGSIGTQTLEVVRQHKERLEVRVLTAGSNAQLLIEQALEFKPDAVVIADENQYEKVVTALQDTDVKVYTGAQALCDVVQQPSVDIVVTAMVGFVGLRPTIAAIEAKKTIALANKETLVVAGELISRLVVENKVRILPVDSEHSAIFQSLVGEGDNTIDKILLTASGGPFRRFTSEQLQNVTAADALKHPNWSMGAKITIDSATLMNKGLEMIEAKWLFGVQPAQIEVVLHPESIIHSAVQFLDGSIKAQLAMPTMCLPILYALSYPERWEFEAERLDFFKLGAMTFEQADTERFPCLRLAYEAIEQGGTMPCIMNAANEIANELFRQGRISFMAIPQIIEETMQRHTVDYTVSLDTYLAADLSARSLARDIADAIS